MVAKAGGVANPVHNGPHPFAPAIGNDGGAVGRPPPNLPDLPALLPALPAPAPAPVLAAAPSRPRPVRRPPPPLPPPNVARKEKQLVRTRSGCGVIESPLEQRITQNTQVLYHVTDAASARAIEESGVMLRGRSNCLFGSGIYFAKTVDIAARKARSAGAVVTAEVDLGRSYLPEAGDATLGFRKLQEMGFDSVHGRAAPLGPLSFHDEYVVYNADQVRVVSVSVPPEPKADEPESPCGILARCLMLAAVVWLAFDVARGCALSGCENGGECEGIVFRTCTCAGLHAGTRCAHHCNCSGHGTQTNLAGAHLAAHHAAPCSSGACHCHDNYAGPSCGYSCGPNGTSDGATCNCTNNFAGEACGYSCSSHGTSNGVACVCRDSYAGTMCDRRCENNATSDGGTGCACTGEYVGEYCQLVGCGSHGRSDGSGSCVCRGRWYGVQCQHERLPPPPPPRSPPCCIG